MASRGTFILADVSGYTPFLTDVGLEHANEITSHLFNGMLKVNGNRWKVANVMGDCLFFLAEGEEPAESAFAHLVALYERFRGSVTDIAERSSCHCGACTRTGDLALKFVVHAGEYDLQNIGDRREVIGSEVVVANRLLKNSVPLQEYVLLSEAAAGIGRASGLPLSEGRDEYGDIGGVVYSYVDLAPVRERFERERQVFVGPDESRLTATVEVAAPVELVWETMMDLGKRRRWQVTLKEMEVLSGPPGQLGEVHRCVHDDGSQMLHVLVGLDREGRRRTEKVWLSRLIKDCYITMSAQPRPGGGSLASFHSTFKPAIPVVSHVMTPLIVREMTRVVQRDMEGLRTLCEDAAREASGA